jgi:hypothetical protein
VIVQAPASDGRHFVVAMHQHTAFAGSLAEHFGNDEFGALEPAEPMQYIVDHHDAGWADLDAQAPQDPSTGLPYNLVATPLPEIISTSAGSPEHNAAHHPFSGVISSMHTHGLYTGRYGLSDKIFLDAIPDDLRPTVDAMLAGEVERQRRLRAELAESDPDYATDEFLFHAYKQLQFFDTLSLYFHMQPSGQRGDTEFMHVPRAVGDDVTVEVRELDDDTYSLAPFPFDSDGVEVATDGRYLAPQTVGTDLAATLASTPVEQQTVRLIAA